MVPWVVSMPPLLVLVAAGALPFGGLTTSRIAVANCLLDRRHEKSATREG